MDVEVGDIVLVKPKGLLSKIIAFLTRSEYSHSCVVFRPTEPILILDIDWTKTRIRPLSYYNDRGYDIYRFIGELSFVQKEKMKNWMLEHIGVEYDYIQLISFLNRILLRINKIFNNPNKFVCSEMVDRLYNSIGIDLIPKYKTGNITPEDLRNSKLLVKIYSSGVEMNECFKS